MNPTLLTRQDIVRGEWPVANFLANARLATFLAVAVVCSPSTGVTAPAASGDWSAVQHIEAGRKIVVTPFKNQGGKVKGYFVSASEEALVLQTGDRTEQSIPRTTIEEVALKGSRGRNALIGLGAGAAGGLVAGAIGDRGPHEGGEGNLYKKVLTTFGAVLGSAIGVLWPTTKTIYRAPTP